MHPALIQQMAAERSAAFYAAASVRRTFEDSPRRRPRFLRALRPAHA